MRQHLMDFLNHLDSVRSPLRIPIAPYQWVSRGPGHFHLAPELFIQIAGWTRFELPHASLHLSQGEALLIPPKLLHREYIGTSDHGEAFSNMVVYAEGGGLRCHLAFESEPGVPSIFHLESCRHPIAQHIHDWLIDASSLCATDHTAGESGSAPETLASRQARALVSAATVGVLQALDERASNAGVAPEPPLVSSVRVLVQNQLGDHQLSVRHLADQVRCTPDYLSNLFSTVTGEHLTSFINRQRIGRATCLLRESTLTSKEIAWSCGFTTQTYFIRTFREHIGVTPKVWRTENNE
jgi:AraC-like DNA-binding protein